MLETALPLSGTNGFSFQRSGVRILDIAEGVLLGLRRYSVERSFTELIDVARRHALSPFELTAALVAAAGGHSTGNPEAAWVVEQEWGRLLRAGGDRDVLTDATD
jgi:hypothetical protein